MALPYLSGHFLFKIWASPWQDNQTIIRPERITPFGGKRSFVNIFDTSYHLPIKNERFHVYQMGQLNPTDFNLPTLEWFQLGKWYSMADWVKESKFSFKFYTDKGLVIPLNHVWFMHAEDKNTVFAIKEDIKIDWNMDEEHITFHTYRNLILNSEKHASENIDIVYKKLKRSNDKNELFDFNRKYEKANGAIFAYVNGVLVDNIVAATLVENDVVEMVFDSMFVKNIEITIASMNTFTSIKDGIRKYLFSHNTNYKLNQLEYFDDIDFYVVGRPNKANKRFNGVLFHRNDIRNVNQVTNCDYSLNVNVVQQAMLNHSFINERDAKVSVIAYYRKQLGTHPMPYVNNRLHELNKLPAVNRMAALLGVRSNIPEWRADELENSNLMRKMREYHPKISLKDAQDIYGYNAISYYTGRVLHSKDEFYPDGIPKSDGKLVNVPYTVQSYSTIFEYDKDGKYLLHQRLGNYGQYPVKHKDTSFVEFVPYVGSRQPDDRINVEETHVDKYLDFRMYACELGTETDPDAWKDVTNDPNYCVAWDNTDYRGGKFVKFTGNKDFTKWFIRTDRDFFCREFEARIEDGLLRFPLLQYYKEGNENLYVRPMYVPFGQLDLYLNGNALIEGIDFNVEFPYINIFNKEYLKEGLEQTILARYMDFADKDLKSISRKMIGYVNNHQLSRNGQYNIFDDKNYIYKIGGGVISKDYLGFADDGSKMKAYLRLKEGRPYEVRDMITPRRVTYVDSCYEIREKSFELDKRVAEYMSQFIKESKVTVQPPIVSMYQLYSPLMARLIHDINNDKLGFDKLETRYNNDEVIAFIDDKYKDFFTLDPYFNDELIDWERVILHPTNETRYTDMSFNGYRFLDTVNKIYFKETLELRNFIRVEN